ncbi:hypothetical protein I4U23_011006 [Adineta vaga]|nr:hypothetical protein I4U23_011006 [Adineta vaga]
MASNSTTNNITSSTVTNSITIVNVILKQIVDQLPLVFAILGLVGFFGNVLTYLQRELRSNTCCIYSLCGSFIDIINLVLNLFANYLKLTYGTRIPWLELTYLCPIQMTSLTFLPYLSLNFLLMAIIDRYASTCSFTSPIRRINKLKMVPLCIVITILISCLASIRVPILYEYRITTGCTITQPLTNNILYMIVNGILQPMTMLIFVLLTYRNLRKSRQRIQVTGEATAGNFRRSRNHFIRMIFVQVIVTAFISLQWTIMFSSVAFLVGGLRNLTQGTFIYIFYLFSNYCYYLNNVKAFYISLLTSCLFRKTTLQIFIKCLPIRYQH